MSKHVSLTLHYPEETVECDFTAALSVFPQFKVLPNPITDYFATTASLVKKIVDTKYANDAEILGLLVLGVVSSAEFYFRSILSELSDACPLCQHHTEAMTIPAGSQAFYAGSGFHPMMSAFEHESLADSKKIVGEIKRFVGLSCGGNTSVKKALDDFELLCELRHCFVHARGFAGLKAVRAIGGPRNLHKVLIGQSQALDFIKLSHNAVRAVNKYLSEEILDRWIEKDVLVGKWSDDKKAFTRYVELFTKRNETNFDGSLKTAYATVRPAIVKRRQGIAAKVGVLKSEGEST